MPEVYGQVRQMPCPDCGNPVHPDREQLCPNCGYPLMFLRKGGGDGDAAAQSIPRSPRPGDDATNLRVVPQPVPQPRTDTPRFTPGSYGGPPRGQVQCRNCGYPNDQARVRCERCGFELRQARPQARQLGPVAYQQQAPARRSWGWLIIVLLILAVLALLLLGGTLLWLWLT
ncbi:zinc-ribbon domain-containing protein [Paractinoplanes globisporus]|uniref:Zinc-ribbon domain-containing protein n=1 Tax=Paractinoplanes globisporus TaxID=113565 RepID=A0ABW6W6M3_9ACTN|nr:zinc-ribbon domain-containing protein [Actinoplanes globisporus]